MILVDGEAEEGLVVGSLGAVNPLLRKGVFEREVVLLAEAIPSVEGVLELVAFLLFKSAVFISAVWSGIKFWFFVEVLVTL